MPIGTHHSDGDGLYLRLQVLPGASRDEIARAYRRLAHDAHPDTNPHDPAAAQRFREITEAYEVLSDPERRASYDRAPGPWPAKTSGRAEPEVTSASAPQPVLGGPPVYLGTGGRAYGPPTGLWAGPVHVGPNQPGPVGRPPSREDVFVVGLAEWLFDVLQTSTSWQR